MPLRTPLHTFTICCQWGQIDTNTCLFRKACSRAQPVDIVYRQAALLLVNDQYQVLMSLCCCVQGHKA